MAEQKKGSKQATMFSFFSPSKSDQKLGNNVAESEPKSVGAKRRRVTSPAAKKESRSANSTKTSDIDSQDQSTPKKLSAKTKSKGNRSAKSSPKPKIKPTPKRKVKPSPKSKAKFCIQKCPVRFISPHAAVDSDEDDDEDVFSTPEARQARAELEAGGETVPAGAPISNDSIVESTEVVDLIGSDPVVACTEEVSGADKTKASETVVSLTAALAEDVTESAVGTVKAKTIKKLPRLPKNAKKQPVKENLAEAKPILMEPLDPALQARVDTYKLKTEDLTRRYTELMRSTQASDTVMQDIYGAGLDRDLDVTVEFIKAQEVLYETWQKLQDHALSFSSPDSAVVPTTVVFPNEVKCLIVKGLQGQTASLSVIAKEILASFKKQIIADGENKSVFEDTRVDNNVLLALEMEIKMLAQRTPYGVRPAKTNVFEDTSVDALWVWEVGNLDRYFHDETQKIIKRMRKNRKRLGYQLKSLARVIHLLHQKPVDEAKVSAEESKVGKFGIIVDAELQKLQDREMKEQDKRHAANEKKQQERERQQAKEAKEEEKRKREREDEEKKLAEASKRQKRFMAFFDAANSAGNCESAIDMTDDQDTGKVEDVNTSQSAVVARMDAAISFLRSKTDASSSLTSETMKLSRASILSSFKHRKNAKKQANEAVLNGWSARRHRDSKLGVMKLLQFYENNRPAYYGTISTRLSLFRGGRRPLAQYAKLDYSVDSDDEWEEDEPGESLSDDENDAEESDEDNLDYEDRWLAYEDEVDYMDGAETEEDLTERGDRTLSPTRHKLPSQLQKKHVKAKAVKPTKLEPHILGPIWCSDGNEGTQTPLHGLVGELLCEPAFESTMMRKAREYEEECERLEAVRLEQQRQKEEQLLQGKLKTQEIKQKTDVVKQTVQTAAKKTTPVKATQATPQKSPTLESTAKLPAASPLAAKSMPDTVPSPPKPSISPIDSFFKKVEDPQLVSSIAPQQPADGQKSENLSEEIVLVD